MPRRAKKKPPLEVFSVEDLLALGPVVEVSQEFFSWLVDFWGFVENAPSSGVMEFGSATLGPAQEIRLNRELPSYYVRAGGKTYPCLLLG